MFVYYFEKRTGRHLVAEDGVFFKGTPANAEEVNPIADATAPGTTGTLRPIRLENMPGISGRLPKLHMQRHGRITPRHSHDEDDGRR